MTPHSSNVYHVQTINNYYYSNSCACCQNQSNHQQPQQHYQHNHQQQQQQQPQNHLIQPNLRPSGSANYSTLMTPQQAPYTPYYPQSRSLNDVLSSLEGQMESMVFHDVMRRANSGPNLSRDERLRNRMFEQMRQFQPPDWASVSLGLLTSTYETDAGLPPSLTLEEINRLPVQRASNSDDTCCICTESIMQGENLRVLPCSHRFHLTCSTQWLLQSNTCPLCRHEIDFEEDDEDIELPPSLSSTDEEDEKTEIDKTQIEDDDKTEILIETTEEYSSNTPNKK